MSILDAEAILDPDQEMGLHKPVKASPSLEAEPADLPKAASYELHCPGADKEPQRPRALAAFTEDPSSIPGTHKDAHNHL